MAGMRPMNSSPVVTRLLQAHGIVLGKTNMEELAEGLTTINPVYGPVLNPYNNLYDVGGKLCRCRMLGACRADGAWETWGVRGSGTRGGGGGGCGGMGCWGGEEGECSIWSWHVTGESAIVMHVTMMMRDGDADERCCLLTCCQCWVIVVGSFPAAVIGCGSFYTFLASESTFC